MDSRSDSSEDSRAGPSDDSSAVSFPATDVGTNISPTPVSARSPVQLVQAVGSLLSSALAVPASAGLGGRALDVPPLVVGGAVSLLPSPVVGGGPSSSRDQPNNY
jgi:hypothetical protein